MHIENVTYAAVGSAKRGALLKLTLGSSGEVWAIRLDEPEDHTRARILVLSVANSRHEAPTVFSIEAKRPALIVAGARVELDIMSPVNLGVRAHNVGSVLVDGTSVKLVAIVWDHDEAESQLVDLSLWALPDEFQNAPSAEFTSWRVRLPPAAEGQRGEVVFSWPLIGK